MRELKSNFYIEKREGLRQLVWLPPLALCLFLLFITLACSREINVMVCDDVGFSPTAIDDCSENTGYLYSYKGSKLLYRTSLKDSLDVVNTKKKLVVKNDSVPGSYFFINRN